MHRQPSPIPPAFHTISNIPLPDPASLPTDALNLTAPQPRPRPPLPPLPPPPPPPPPTTAHLHLQHQPHQPSQPQPQHLFSHPFPAAENNPLNRITTAMSHQPQLLPHSQPQQHRHPQIQSIRQLSQQPQPNQQSPHHIYEHHQPQHDQQHQQQQHQQQQHHAQQLQHTQQMQHLQQLQQLQHHASQLHLQQPQSSTPIQQPQVEPQQPQLHQQPQPQPQDHSLEQSPYPECYSFLNSLPVRELRKIARQYRVRQTSANKLALISRIMLHIIETLQTGQITIDSYFADIEDDTFHRYLVNWRQVQPIPIPSLEFLRDVATGRPLDLPGDTSAEHVSEKRPQDELTSLSSDRAAKRMNLVSTPFGGGADVHPVPDLTDDEFARLVLLLRYDATVREQYRKNVQSGPTVTSVRVGMVPDFWTSTVESLFNSDAFAPRVSFPSHVTGIVNAHLKPIVWRDGEWLRVKLAHFGEMFAKVYREYRHSTLGDMPFHDYCRAQCLDFNRSLVRRYLVCAHLVKTDGINGIGAEDETFLAMLSCDLHDPSDAVSQVGFSGEKRHVSSNSENDAPTSMNTAEYEDITRNMYHLLTVLKDRVAKSIVEGSEYVNGDDIVKVIEQKEALLYAFSRAQQKSSEASTSDMKHLWGQHADDIRNMLNVLATK